MGLFESILDIVGNATISRGSKLCGGSGEGLEQERRDWEEPRFKEEGDDFFFFLLENQIQRNRKDLVIEDL